MEITKETRRASYRETGKSAKARQNAVLDILARNDAMTAREIAQVMFQRGITPTNERNHAAPRLTELLDEGKVKVVGKKACGQTGRMVALWAICPAEEEA